MIKGIDAIKLAKFMHETYERESKKCGWETQKITQVSFKDLPSENKQVMIVTATLVIDWINKNQEDI